MIISDMPSFELCPKIQNHFVRQQGSSFNVLQNGLNEMELALEIQIGNNLGYNLAIGLPDHDGLSGEKTSLECRDSRKCNHALNALQSL